MIDEVEVVDGENRQQPKGNAQPEGCPGEGGGLGIITHQHLQKPKVEPHSQFAKTPVAIGILQGWVGIGAGQKQAQRTKEEQWPTDQNR